MELKVNPEYEAILPKLLPEEFESLKNSIKEDGQLYPIIVNQDGIILDGHHRFKACKELGITPKIEVRTFSDKLEEKKFVIEVNLKRRHLLPFQRAEMGMVLLEVEEELARKRQESTQIKAGKPPTRLPPIGGDRGEAAEIVAKKIGLGRGTFERAVKVIEEAPEIVKEKARKGEISILEGYEITRALEKVEDPEKREYLEEKLEEGLTAKELKKIVMTTQAVYSMTEILGEEGQEEILDLFRDKLWTEELNINEVKAEIEKRYSPSKMEKLEVEGWLFKKKEEAEDFAYRYNGNFKRGPIFIFEFPTEFLEKAKEEVRKRNE